MKKQLSLKTLLLTPIIIILLTMITGFVFSQLTLEKRYTEQHLHQKFDSARQLYEATTKFEKEKIVVFLQILEQDKELQADMRSQNKVRLLKHLNSHFQILQQNHISHFYIHQPNLVNYLRVHQPQRYGDQIQRQSALDAAETQQIAWGVEMGPLGLLTLRAVMPWFDQGELLGYIELGQEIEHVYEHVYKNSDIGLFISINKEVIDRQAWESGMTLMNREHDWNLLPKSVVTFSSLLFNQTEFCLALCKIGETSYQYQEALTKDHTYQTYSLPIMDEQKSDQPIGKMVFFKDLTEIKKEFTTHLIEIIGFSMVASVVLFIFIYLFIDKIESKINRSNRKLFESEKRFRHLVESSTDWIWELDAKGRYTYASPKVRDFLGYEPEELLGKSPFDLMPEDEAKRLSVLFEEYALHKKPFFEMENTNLHKNGTKVYLETNGIPLLDKEQNLIGFRGVDRNITQRKQQELEIKKMTQKVLMHFEQTPLGVIEWGNNFEVLNWNPAAENIFGYKKEDAIGKSAMDLIITDKDKEYVFEVWQALMSKQVGGGQARNENCTADGRIIQCEWYNTPLIDQQGNVIGVASFVEDVTEQLEAQANINHMAYYDTLTGLANRTLFEDRLKQAIISAKRKKTLLSVLFVDIDHFKKVNDTLGHQFGDVILQEVASRILKCVRANDTIARFGGDEFSILLVDLECENDIERVISSIRQAFKLPFEIEEKIIFITLSIGSVTYPQDGSSAEFLMSHADAAMYVAKQKGRNQHQPYANKMTERIVKSLILQTDMRKALSQQEFELYYQPQINSKSHKISGVEALIRWNHPQKGIISPADFIPEAEDSGLMIPLGDWIYQTAFHQLKAWQLTELSPITMAINLSPVQFRKKNFIDNLIAYAEKLELDPQWIELEITESLLVDRSSSILNDLLKLRVVGFKLALDDFGTGYSSLSYLKHFPMTKLKIDQLFIRELFVDESNLSLVRAIIAMATALGLDTIAEGVELETQLDFLATEGCQEIQGYFFDKPMQAHQILEKYLNH